MVSQINTKVIYGPCTTQQALRTYTQGSFKTHSNRSFPIRVPGPGMRSWGWGPSPPSLALSPFPFHVRLHLGPSAATRLPGR